MYIQQKTSINLSKGRNPKQKNCGYECGRSGKGTKKFPSMTKKINESSRTVRLRSQKKQPHTTAANRFLCVKGGGGGGKRNVFFFLDSFFFYLSKKKILFIFLP